MFAVTLSIFYYKTVLLLAAVESVHFHNHSGLAFIYRDCIKFHKKLLDFNVSTFDYMCGLAAIC